MILSFAQLHDEVTRLVNAIGSGGGGGGSTVTVTQKRTTGDNIAAITVNGNTTELYAPNDAKDIAFDNDKEGVFLNDNVQDVLDEVGYALTDHDSRITQNTSDISDLNDTLNKPIIVKQFTQTLDNGANLTAENISGYKFFCWGASSVSGVAAYTQMSSFITPTTTVWFSNGNRCTGIFTAIYVKENLV